MTQKIKLSPETVNILRNFSGIHRSILIRKGNVLTTIAETKSIIAKATIAESFETDFAIADLPRFLSVLSLFEDPELEIGDKFVTIKEGKKKLNYTFADTRHVQSIEAEAIDKLNAVVDKGEIEFDWENAVFADVNKALLVMKLPELEVRGDGQTISIRALDSKDPTGSNYSVDVGETTETFSALFRSENIKFLPLDYKVKYSTRGIARLTSDGITYLVTTESKKK